MYSFRTTPALLVILLPGQSVNQVLISMNCVSIGRVHIACFSHSPGGIYQDFYEAYLDDVDEDVISSTASRREPKEVKRRRPRQADNQLRDGTAEGTNRLTINPDMARVAQLAEYPVALGIRVIKDDFYAERPNGSTASMVLTCQQPESWKDWPV